MKHWVTESLRKIIGSELLPGRRWLLSSDSRNQHILYDLHIPSPRPQKLANPGQCDHKDRTMGELRSLKIWVDSCKENLCFRFVVWRSPGPSERNPAYELEA